MTGTISVNNPVNRNPNPVNSAVVEITAFFDLKSFFKFDINKDSGFNKNLWERVKEYSPEILKECIVALIAAVIGAVIALSFANVIK